MRKLLFLLIISPFLLIAADFYPKMDVCDSLGIDTEFVKTNDLKSVCIDFVPTTLQKRTVLESIESAGENFPLILQKLRENEIPDVIIFVAVTESKFSSKYANKKVYAGIWQLSRLEAKLFGLKIDQKKKIDERRDIEKSTDVFIKLLKENYQKFGSWPLAIIAYNAGEGRLQSGIRKSGTDDIETLLYKKKRYLPKTSANYLKKIIIYASSANYPPVYDKINTLFKAVNTHEDNNETNGSN